MIYLDLGAAALKNELGVKKEQRKKKPDTLEQIH